MMAKNDSDIESGFSRWDALRISEIEDVQTFERPSAATLSPVDPPPPPPPVGSVGDRALLQPPVSSLGERRTPRPVSSLRDRPRPISSLRDTPAVTRREADLTPPVWSPPALPVEEALPKPKMEVSPDPVGGIGAGDGRNGTSNVITKEDPHSVAVELPVSPPVTSPDRIPAYQGRPVARKLRDSRPFVSMACNTTYLWQEETAMVVSTVLLVTGVTALLHSYLGTRLPLVQGSSFVYLAPALAIANSQEFRNLSDNVVIYSPARTATQQGSGKVGRWKINFLSTQKWENPLMGWTSTGDPYANVGDAGFGFDSKESAKAFAEKHGWEYTVRKRHTPLLKVKAYADNFKWKGPPNSEE